MSQILKGTDVRIRLGDKELPLRLEDIFTPSQIEALNRKLERAWSGSAMTATEETSRAHRARQLDALLARSAVRDLPFACWTDGLPAPG